MDEGGGLYSEAKWVGSLIMSDEDLVIESKRAYIS
jgi:hypothetical protein